ncbi:Uncharacterised protein [Mycobacterium tuberculosis]|nr:Uncharacterised protein [Mycobacterium tuberculosis]CKT57138.1 Uncharacterised protein [Mycobacterium tuberculosis]
MQWRTAASIPVRCCGPGPVPQTDGRGRAPAPSTPQDRCQAEHRATRRQRSHRLRRRPATSRPTSAAVWHTASRRSHCPRRQDDPPSLGARPSLGRCWPETPWNPRNRSRTSADPATASPGPRTRRRGHLRRAWHGPARARRSRSPKTHGSPSSGRTPRRARRQALCTIPAPGHCRPE